MTKQILLLITLSMLQLGATSQSINDIRTVLPKVDIKGTHNTQLEQPKKTLSAYIKSETKRLKKAGWKPVGTNLKLQEVINRYVNLMMDIKGEFKITVKNEEFVGLAPSFEVAKSLALSKAFSKYNDVYSAYFYSISADEILKNHMKTSHELKKIIYKKTLEDYIMILKRGNSYWVSVFGNQKKMNQVMNSHKTIPTPILFNPTAIPRDTAVNMPLKINSYSSTLKKAKKEVKRLTKNGTIHFGRNLSFSSTLISQWITSEERFEDSEKYKYLSSKFIPRHYGKGPSDMQSKALALANALKETFPDYSQYFMFVATVLGNQKSNDFRRLFERDNKLSRCLNITLIEDFNYKVYISPDCKACFPQLISILRIHNDSLKNRLNKYFTNDLRLFINDSLGDCKNGYGILYTDYENSEKYKNGIIYKGHWKEGKYQGKGTEYAPDGSITFSGMWKNGRHAEDVDFEESQRSGEYEVYIQQYPNGSHTNKAKKIVEQKAFESAKQSNNLGAFLKKYPNGYYSKDAKRLIEKEVFDLAQKNNDYENYLSKYPNGLYTQAAKKIIEKKPFELAKRNNDYESYLNKYPNGLYALEAKKIIEKKHSEIVKRIRALPILNTRSHEKLTLINDSTLRFVCHRGSSTIHFGDDFKLTITRGLQTFWAGQGRTTTKMVDQVAFTSKHTKLLIFRGGSRRDSDVANAIHKYSELNDLISKTSYAQRFKQRASKREEQELYFSVTKNRNDISKINTYLEKFPYGSHSQEIKALEEKYYYDKAIQDFNTYNGKYFVDLRKYLRKYPNGKYAKEINELTSYSTAKNGSLNDCQVFISKYPTSKFVPEIKERSFFLKQKKANAVANYNAYISKYTNGQYVEEAKSAIASIEEKAEIERKRKARAQKVKSNSDVRKWDLGLKICRQDYRGIVMGTIEQWNNSKSRVQIKVAASPGGLTSEGDKLTKGNTIWINPKQGWHLCLNDEKQYALKHDKSADFEKYTQSSSSSSNTKKGKFEVGETVRYTWTEDQTWFGQQYATYDYYIKAIVLDWNGSYTKMKLKVTATDSSGKEINSQSIYKGAEIWVSPYGWK